MVETRTLLHEMAYLYFFVVMKYKNQSANELKTKMDILTMKLSEWTEDKNAVSNMIRDIFIELLQAGHEENEGSEPKIFKCMANIKEFMPNNQHIYIIDDLVDIVNVGLPHDEQIRTIGMLVEYFGVSLDGEKYNMIKEYLSNISDNTEDVS